MTFTTTGHLTLDPPGQRVLASDGASRPAKPGQPVRLGMGYVATTGQWGMRQLDEELTAHQQPALLAELHAAAWATRRLTSPTREFVLLTDSRDALAFITAWQQGSHELPTGYPARKRDGRPSLLAAWASQLADGTVRVDARWQRGHAGHALNELADSLAKLAVRSSPRDRRDVGRIAGEWVRRRHDAVVEAAASNAVTPD
ncbi:RNase H family protein [Actinopolyspora erythraea]|nr:RNase H family protein [Actinopolyspora erythraea]